MLLLKNILTEDGGEFIKKNLDGKFDLIFADTWPGKFYLPDEVLSMLKVGGIFIIDDLLPQPTWPEGHHEKVKDLVHDLENRENLVLTKLEWSTGLIIATMMIDHSPCV